MINKNTYMISDTHFGHYNIRKFEPIRLEMSYKFNFNENLDDFMMARWNSIVSKEDTVFHLGDLYFEGRNSTFDIKKLSNLNGNKILLIGNHDRTNYLKKLDKSWKIIDKIEIDLNNEFKNEILNKLNNNFKLSQKEKRLQVCYITEINETRILFSHFPLYDNNQYDLKYQNIVKSLEFLYESFNCQVNIHGHIHSHDSAFKNSINVSIEKLDFNPVKLKNLLIKKLTFDLKKEFKFPLMKAKMIAHKELNWKNSINFIKNTKDGHFEFGMLDYKESKEIKELREGK
jgi:calcineurin-like phosphoesterase family protein